MAAQHAGFALVTCLTEGLANGIIEAAFQNHLGPLTFVLPTPLQIGSATVTLSGQFTVLPPVVAFTRRPDNLVSVRGRFVADLHLEGATKDPVDVAVELGCSLLVGLRTAVVAGRFQVGLDLSQASVTAADVTVVDGPSLASPYGAALRSVPALAALTAALRSVPPHLLRTTVDGFPVTVTLAPRGMPCGASLFELPEMFHASFAVSRVITRTLDRQLAIGVDIAGITLGDPSRLETLFGATREVWIRTDGPEGTVGFSSRAVKGSGNLAVSLNPDAIVALLRGPLSQATNHAFVNCHVALEGLSMSFGKYSPPLQPQFRIDVTTLHVGARYYDAPGRDAQSRLTPGGASIRADASSPFAVHYQTFDGPTDFLSSRGEYWFIKVYEGSVEVPWWVSFGLVLLGVAVPVLALPVLAVLDGILPSLLGNVAAQIQRNAQSGISGAASTFGLSARSKTLTLPGLPRTPCTETTNLISMTGEGFDFFSTLWLATAPDTSKDRNIVVVADGTRLRDGEGITRGVVAPSPVACTVQVKDGVVDPLDSSVRVSWEVRRLDSGAMVIQQDMALRSIGAAKLGALVGGGGGATPRRIVIDRTSAELMPVPEFSVVVRVYRPLSGRVKEFGSSRFKVTIADRFDRSHPYVHWDGWAAGAPKRSVLHRTAAPGRCSMIMRAANKAKFQYLDDLPFPVGELAQHRKEVCSYCFYGGPEKQVPLI